MMNVLIRNERVADYKIVEGIARDAFWNLYFPGAHEHFVVHQMRHHPDFINELSFVVEVEKDVQGAIFYTHSKIVTPSGDAIKTISFGPVFIAPPLHRRGLGKALITHSIAIAKERGHRAIVTLGYPYHYEPYGFRGGKKYGISMSDGNFYKGLLVLPLYEGALQGISGHAVFSDVFECDQEEVDAFDRTFPPKEKKVQKSQEEYELACSQLDE